VIAGNVAVQVKTRQTLPGWLLAAMDQAERDAVPGQVPIVALSAASRGKKARRLVVFDLDTFARLAGRDPPCRDDLHADTDTTVRE
jgi:hypothetical protein